MPLVVHVQPETTVQVVVQPYDVPRVVRSQDSEDSTMAFPHRVHEMAEFGVIEGVAVVGEIAV